MPITEAPPHSPREPRVARPDLPQDPAELHLLIEELEDERQKGRWRESVWLSVILHLLLILLIIIQPKFFPDLFSAKDKVSVVEATPDQNVQFLALPKDLQKPTPPPKTSILSDKNRIAQARTPSLDRHTLEELQNARRQGSPGPRAMAAPPPKPSPAAAPPQPAQQQAQASAQKPADNSNQVAKLETPPQPKPMDRNVFQSATSAGSQIQQAARAAAQGRGSAGDFGAGPLNPNTPLQSDVNVLSDTLGVDFGPYLARVIEDIRRNWYGLIPESVIYPPHVKGKLTLQFVITKNGSVDGLRLVAGSGNVALDRAAWGGITASNPFPPLPKEFVDRGGPYLALAIRFYYNPDKGDIK